MREKGFDADGTEKVKRDGVLSEFLCVFKHETF